MSQDIRHSDAGRHVDIAAMIDEAGLLENGRRMARKSAVLLFGPSSDPPWWWDEIRNDRDVCAISFRSVTVRNKRSSKHVSAWELPLVLWAMLPVYLRLRKDGFDYVFTFECSLTTFALSFWQTLLFQRRPRHVVLQFVMRERTRRLGNMIKYLAMKACFASLHMAICSSTGETRYYAKAFKWSPRKVGFVPMHTGVGLTVERQTADAGYVFSAGRTFRDFPTLYSAIGEAGGYPAYVVAGFGTPKPPADATNIQLLMEVPYTRFLELLRNARVVVVALHEMQIAAGQLVLLQAMALGKAVIATKTTGTVDYIQDGINGLLVRPSSPGDLRKAIDDVMRDASLRARLGAAARKAVLENYLPSHYFRGVQALLQNSATR